MLRLRQLVLAARDLDPAVAALRTLLDADPPYRDPDIGVFGLANAVLTAGTDVVEVVSPVAADAPVQRWLDRRGGADGGYMLMVDGPPALLDRDRLATLGARVVHEVVRPDVTDVHLHPRDVGGVLLALDTVDPPGSWRWAGPAWTGTSPDRTGGLSSVTIAVDDPAAVTRRWAELLDLPDPAGSTELELDGGRQRLLFRAGESGRSGAVAATFSLPVDAPRHEVVAGVALDVVPTPTEPS